MTKSVLLLSPDRLCEHILTPDTFSHLCMLGQPLSGPTTVHTTHAIRQAKFFFSSSWWTLMEKPACNNNRMMPANVMEGPNYYGKVGQRSIWPASYSSIRPNLGHRAHDKLAPSKNLSSPTARHLLRTLRTIFYIALLRTFYDRNPSDRGNPEN